MRIRSVPLGEIVEITRDAVLPEAIKPGTRYVGLENITGSGEFIGVHAVENGDLASTKFSFTAKHVLYGKLRPYLRKIARPNFDGICSTDILPLMPGPKIERNYLAHFLRLDSSVAFAESRSVGVNLPRINPGVLATMEIPLPPLEEQRRIAAILDKADVLRQKRRLALQKLDSLSEAFFEFQRTVSVKSQSIASLLEAGYLTMHKDGNHGSNYPRAEEFGGEGIAFLSAKAISADGTILDGEVERLNEQKAAQLKIGWLESGDVLLAHNASVGKVGIYRGQFGKALIGTSLTCFRTSPDKLRATYLYAALRSRFFRRSSRRIWGKRRGIRSRSPPKERYWFQSSLLKLKSDWTR